MTVPDLVDPPARLTLRLRDGERLSGTILSLGDVALAELAATAFDHVWIDLEHGSLGARDVQSLAVAVQSTGACALVRLPRWDTEALPAILDAGVDGVVVPGIESADAMRALVERLRYPPAGRRGFGPRRAGGYGRTPRFWSSPGAEVACLAQIESAAGVEAAASIAAVDGVDALVVGCADLSFALGAPQDLEAPALREAVDRVRAACHAAGIAFGIAGSGDLMTLCELAGSSAQLLVYSADVRIYAQAMDEAAGALAVALGIEVREEELDVRP